MTSRYTSTLDIITLLEEIIMVIRDNDHKINKLMLSADNPNFKGLWATVEPQVFNKKHLNYRGVKVLMYKLMICLIQDVHQPVSAWPDYDDEFYGESEQPFSDEPEERFDSVFSSQFEDEMEDDYKNDIEDEFKYECEEDRINRNIQDVINCLRNE
ncbi:hypothetical protein [Pseudoalteromonas sp. S1727]|uniref:hypothetical protein n=1 Tax=Pseudoalteromonas sp. S1727 TaxID=2066514 RepID=UPI0020160EF4|nr:hypothetical protein [Pseudoalteromonas sp. S1727]